MRRGPVGRGLMTRPSAWSTPALKPVSPSVSCPQAETV